MPFPMAHLCIARIIVERCSKPIVDLPQFYLGTLSPDSVHFRPNYSNEYKKTSHLCLGDFKWGEVTNYTEWIENVLLFMQKNKQSINHDFIYGYCAHIVADIFSNINFWMPFKLKYPEEIDRGPVSLYNAESVNVDLQLSQEIEYKDEIWAILEKSKSINIPYLVCIEEIDSIKENILYKQYSNISKVDTSSNKFVTYDATIKFINDASNFVLEKLS